MGLLEKLGLSFRREKPRDAPKVGEDYFRADRVRAVTARAAHGAVSFSYGQMGAAHYLKERNVNDVTIDESVSAITGTDLVDFCDWHQGRSAQEKTSSSQVCIMPQGRSTYVFNPSHTPFYYQLGLSGYARTESLKIQRMYQTLSARFKVKLTFQGDLREAMKTLTPEYLFNLTQYLEKTSADGVLKSFPDGVRIGGDASATELAYDPASSLADNLSLVYFELPGTEETVGALDDQDSHVSCEKVREDVLRGLSPEPSLFPINFDIDPRIEHFSHDQAATVMNFMQALDQTFWDGMALHTIRVVPQRKGKTPGVFEISLQETSEENGAHLLKQARTADPQGAFQWGDRRITFEPGTFSPAAQRKFIEFSQLHLREVPTQVHTMHLHFGAARKNTIPYGDLAAQQRLVADVYERGVLPLNFADDVPNISHYIFLIDLVRNHLNVGKALTQDEMEFETAKTEDMLPADAPDTQDLPPPIFEAEWTAPRMQEAALEDGPSLELGVWDKIESTRRELFSAVEKFFRPKGRIFKKVTSAVQNVPKNFPEAVTGAATLGAAVATVFGLGLQGGRSHQFTDEAAALNSTATAPAVAAPSAPAASPLRADPVHIPIQEAPEVRHSPEPVRPRHPDFPHVEGNNWTDGDPELRADAYIAKCHVYSQIFPLQRADELPRQGTFTYTTTPFGLDEWLQKTFKVGDIVMNPFTRFKIHALLSKKGFNVDKWGPTDYFKFSTEDGGRVEAMQMKKNGTPLFFSASQVLGQQSASAPLDQVDDNEDPQSYEIPIGEDGLPMDASELFGPSIQEARP